MCSEGKKENKERGEGAASQQSVVVFETKPLGG
jgi:hypothetical protein